MFDTKQLWDKTLEYLQLEVSKANFTTWLKNTHITKEEGGIVYVGVPNEFVKEWLVTKYNKLITKTLIDLSDQIRGVEYVITKIETKQKDHLLSDKLFNIKELPLQDLYNINKDDNLNPRYTFETFIVGTFNELAYAAAKSIVAKPGISYNPFFVYGGTGLGKTHMLQAMGNEVKKNFPEKKVHYITLEKFATDLVNSFQTNKANSFKEKYRKYDMLIIDDIQFIGKMERTQEELFHTFNTFFQNNKAIIFSSDKHPNHIPGLEDRLRTRFGQGMIVDITDPDYESRLAILQRKITENNIHLNADVVSYVADVVEGSIRELEGALNTILCHIQLKQRQINLQETKLLLKNSIKPKKTIPIEEVVNIITQFYNLEKDAIYEKTRRKEIVKARQITMFLLREDFSISYPMIGQRLGGKDHTTVIHSHMKIKNDVKINPAIKEEIEQIRMMFK